MISQEQLKELRREYPAGTRIRLVRMDDEQAPPVGTCGTVAGVDDTGSLMVKWDNGGSLNVLWEIDEIKKEIEDDKS